MTWDEAKTVARAGKYIRREGWIDRWISFSQYLWWLTPVDIITLSRSVPRVVRAPDWTPGEFLADDWTTDPIVQSPLIKTFIDQPGELLLPFDFAILRYSWKEEAGADLDTRTAIIIPPRDIDVGWNRGDIGPDDTRTDGPYLTWGGDNISSPGFEAVMIDFRALLSDFPDETEFLIRLRANWFEVRGTGDITIQFQTWKGGVISHIGTDFQNNGGALVQDIPVSRNIVSKIRNDVDGDPAGYLYFDAATQTAHIQDAI